VPKKFKKAELFLKLMYRKLKYGYAFRRIELTRGKYTIVDPEDYGWLNKYKWHTNCGNGKFYAANKNLPKMHRLIIKPPNNLFVDHINGNGLDNRKANLRLATCAQNNWNSNCGKNYGKSKYKGVNWHKYRKKWFALAGMYGKKVYLGYYSNEEEAARAYDKYVKEHRGEFAVLNFPGKKRRIRLFKPKSKNRC
jgi:hypothetical protein